MATIYHNLSAYDAEAMPSKDQVKNQRYAIVVADWNPNVTYPLLEGAFDALVTNGVAPEHIMVKHVPGTFELTFAAKRILREYNDMSAVIVIGCVVQGDTPHFDYVCQGVTYGIAQLNLQYKIPFIFGVLTTSDLQQAIDRAGGKHGNKGDEGAITAIKMIDFSCSLQK